MPERARARDTARERRGRPASVRERLGKKFIAPSFSFLSGCACAGNGSARTHTALTTMNYGLEAGLAELAVAPVHPTVEEVVSFFFWRGVVIGAAMRLLFHRALALIHFALLIPNRSRSCGSARRKSCCGQVRVQGNSREKERESGEQREHEQSAAAFFFLTQPSLLQARPPAPSSASPSRPWTPTAPSASTPPPSPAWPLWARPSSPSPPSARPCTRRAACTRPSCPPPATPTSPT